MTLKQLLDKPFTKLIDSNYSYVGVFLIGVATVLETYFNMIYRRTDQENE